MDLIDKARKTPERGWVAGYQLYAIPRESNGRDSLSSRQAGTFAQQNAWRVLGHDAGLADGGGFLRVDMIGSIAFDRQDKAGYSLKLSRS